MFAVCAGAFVPLNFAAVRLAEAYTHPRTLSNVGGNLPAEMGLTFAVSLVAMALLYLTLTRLELASKRAARASRRPRRSVPIPAANAR